MVMAAAETTVLSVDQVARESAELMRHQVPRSTLARLAGDDNYVRVENLTAGYGRTDILHGVDLQVGRGQSLCLIGPNGAGKSTVLHSIYGFTVIRGGQLAKRRAQPARVLSGGERRLLEISRALVMDPQVLLVDEPSIGLEPRFIGMVFEILTDLCRRERKTVIMVEQNARKGLEFADIGYVLVSGQLALAGGGRELLENAQVGRLFLGG